MPSFNVHYKIVEDAEQFMGSKFRHEKKTVSAANPEKAKQEVFKLNKGQTILIKKVKVAK